MNTKLNLCEILKGHEGEIFYSPIFGNITLYGISSNEPYPIKLYVNKPGGSCSFTSEGKYYKCSVDAECMLFPSKEQRDWNKWVKENNKKTPKIWDKIIVNKDSLDLSIKLSPEHDGLHQNYYYEEDHYEYPIVKSAVALIKIHQLIEVGYGGNVTNDEWNNCRILKYVIIYRGNKFCEDEYELQKEVVAFHTSEQRKEFLSYPENVQLLRDYFMI